MSRVSARTAIEDLELWQDFRQGNVPGGELDRVIVVQRLGRMS
ncbi:MAG: hypothetical protein WBC76_04540 [Actinomycetes bacterium]